MNVVWSRAENSVRDVLAALEGPYAYTTIMTTLDRLHRKGLLVRRKQGRAFVYAAACSRETLQQRSASGLLAALFSRVTTAEPVLHTIVDVVGERDKALLDELDRLVQEKRRQLGDRT
jgi:predicted transcriptional regulator